MSQRDSGPSGPSAPSAERVVAIGRATLRNVDFRKARFDTFSVSGCLFLACDFRGVRLDRRYQPLFSARPRSVFRDCRFDGADLRGVRPDHARFERCTFDDALLDGWRTDVAELVGCRFAGALGRVTFSGRPLGPRAAVLDPPRARNEFALNDFVDAELDDVVFIRGIDLAAQRLPLDERYVRLDHFAQRVARARSEVARWEEQQERRAAIAMLRDLSKRWREQPEIITARLDGRSSVPARVRTRVWAVLERDD